LPVSAHADELVQLLKENQVLVVAGDTGSGKTTQLPKVCLQAGFGRLGLIGHTQPRRLAAVSVADRIASELGAKVGEGVGFQIRFDDKSSESSYLKLMTDGILLAEIQQDRYLNKYEVLIIDEAHERSLNIDFLLGYLKTLLKKRPELKLIITSATIDVEKFSAHFNQAPVVSVVGRTYPVETRYAPLPQQSDSQFDDDLQINGIIDAVKEIDRIDGRHKKLSGDVLIFFASEREIRETALKLRKQKFPNTDILPLYGRLKHSEQVKIFSPHKGRRLVLATNVAETSITVPGIRYVIDTGLARISRYSLQSKVQRLPIEEISQASANQRKGRCGRVEEGVCIRLYSEENFDKRPLFTDPEIIRTNLAAVILRMHYLGLGEVENFPFLEPPEQKAVNEGIKLLIELNALTPKHQLTDIGRSMAQLPVDPKYGRMLIVAHEQSCLREMLIIVSALSIQDPREISSENRQQAKEVLAEFSHEDSDFLGFVKLWDHYEKLRQDSNQGQLKRYCKSHFLSYMRMREWREVHRQLLLSCQHMGFRPNRESASYAAVHKSIISGSLNQIAQKQDARNYLGNRNKKFSLFSSSVLANSKAKWIVSGELIETSQTFATMAAKIQAQWVVDMALHLVKRNYFEPHWSAKRQETVVYERVTLYGLAIIEKNLVSFEEIDPEGSREIFIREALTGNQLANEFGFLQRNVSLLQNLEKQEDKLRRPDIIVSEKDIRSFYDQQIPKDIHSSRGLKEWLKKAGGKAGKSLEMSKEKLIKSQSALDKIAEFPDAAAIQQNKLSIDYVFDPGSKSDGASIDIPLIMLSQLTQADVDWSVPGIIRDRCIALLKSLHKAQRKNFIPVSGFVDEALLQMNKMDGDLIDSLLAQIRNHKKISLSKADFNTDDLPEHLQVKIRVLDDKNNEVAYGKNLSSLKKELGAGSADGLKQAEQQVVSHEMECAGLTDWSFDMLPQSIEIKAALTLTRYPALIDRGETVDLVLLADQQSALERSREGVARLCMLRSVQQKNMLHKKFKRLQQDLALYLPGNLSSFEKDATRLCYFSAFELEDKIPRSQQEFEQLLVEGKPRILSFADKIEKLLELTLRSRRELAVQIENLNGAAVKYAKDDLETQLNGLVHENFLSKTGLLWFTEYPRYFEAVKARLSRAPHLGEKDQSNSETIAKYWNRYLSLLEQMEESQPDNLKYLRWMIEELRVSLFAQNLGTRMPVSPRRIEKHIEKILSASS
jgi:ATP-dependent helicase HrpA